MLKKKGVASTESSSLEAAAAALEGCSGAESTHRFALTPVSVTAPEVGVTTPLSVAALS